MNKKFLTFFGLLILTNALFASNVVAPAKTESLLRRISLLEAALAPTSAEAVAATWTQAVKNRNGAVQYMLLCPSLQKQHLATLEALNWVTGVSSPWVSSYKIIPQTIKDKIIKFTIQYQLAAGGNEKWTTIDHISIVHMNQAKYASQQWCISQFNHFSPVEQLTARSN